MHKVSALVVMACAAFAAAGAAAAPCPLSQSAEYPVRMLNNHPLVEASINGRPVRLLVDLGSRDTVITRDAAQAIGLNVRETNSTLYRVGGGESLGLARAQVLRVGDRVEHDVYLAVAGSAKSSSGAEGALGLDFLADRDVEFDLAHGVIRQFSSRQCAPADMVYWANRFSSVVLENRGRYGLLLVDVKLDGRTLTAALGSGAPTTVVTTGAARAAGFSPEAQGRGPVGHYGGTGSGQAAIPIWLAVFPSFVIGDESIYNAQLSVADFLSGDQVLTTGSRSTRNLEGLPAMLLGADFIYAHRIYLARDQGRLYFTYNGGRVFGGPTPNTVGPPKP